MTTRNHGDTISAGFDIALVTVDTDLERGACHGLVDRNRQPEIVELIKRYRDVAASILAGTDELLRFGYDPMLSVAGGGSRYITSGDTSNRILLACCEATGVMPTSADIAIVFGPGILSLQTTPEMFREIVADDLTAIIQSSHPVQCDGPIETLMPFLVQVAGNVIIPGQDGTETGDSKLAGRQKRAIGRAFNAIAHTYYDDPNPHGRVVTDHPAWLPLATAVAVSAGAFAYSIKGPLERGAFAHLIQQAIAKAMHACAVPVVSTRSP